MDYAYDACFCIQREGHTPSCRSRRRWRWLRRHRSVSIGTRFRWTFGLDLDSINRPHVGAWWHSPARAGVSVSWGNGNSDPVWCVDLEFPVPRRWSP